MKRLRLSTEQVRLLSPTALLGIRGGANTNPSTIPSGITVPATTQCVTVFACATMLGCE